MPTLIRHQGFSTRGATARRRGSIGLPVEPLEARTLFDATMLKQPPAVNGAAGGSQSIDVSEFVGDPTVDTQVRFTTSLGTIDVQLDDQTKPLSVANFLNYVRTGRYNDTFIHRSTSVTTDGIGVIQGGGYTNNPLAQHVTTDAPITDEAPTDPVLSNVTGTIAMARTSDADSATSEWFINVTDNTSLDPSQQPPGYAVFGTVVNDTMTTATAIAALPTFNFGQTFATLPLRNYTQDDYNNPAGAKSPTVADNLVVVSNAETLPELAFTATSSNPAVVTPVVSGNKLTLQYLSEGEANITVTGMDTLGNTASVTFAASTKTTVNLGGTGNPTSMAFTDGDGTVTTVSIKGAGTAAVTLNGAGLTTATAGKKLSVTGTVDSIATIAVTGGSASTAITIAGKGGDGAVGLTTVTSDSALKSFSAKPVALAGAMTFTGAVGTVDLGSVNNGSVTIGGAATDKPVGITVAGTATGASFTSTPPIKSFTAGAFAAGTSASGTATTGAIVTPVLGKLSSKGAMTEKLTVNGPIQSITAGGDVTIDASADSIGSVSVKGSMVNSSFQSTRAFAAAEKPIGKVTVTGDITSSLIEAAGNLTSVSATTISGSTIFAGIASSSDLHTLPTAAADFASQATITSITIKGGYSDTRIAGAKLGKIAIGTVNNSNSGTAFGVAADTAASITGTIGDGKLALKKLAAQTDVTNQTTGLTLGDFAVNVI